MQKSPLISLQNASIAIGPKVLLQDLTWSLQPGEHWVISGPCGAGKTVFVEFLANKHRLASGSRSYSLSPSLPLSEQLKTGLRLISFTDTGDLFLNYRDINYYQQRFNAFDAEGHLTMEAYFEQEREEIEKHRDLLEGMGIYHLLEVERIKLSSGQTRKMLLAKVLMSQPKVLILDNAYIGLDSSSRKVLNQVLDELVHTREISLILAGHHRELPQCINKRLYIDKNHRVEEIPVEYPAPRSVPPVDAKKIEAIRAHFHSQSFLENSEEVIRMDQVHIQYGGKSILGPLDWRVKPGEKWAVYGPNGSGKSTLLSLIYADNPQAYSQEIYLFGKKRGSGESIWDLKKQMGFSSPELHAYFRDNPIAQSLVLTGLTDTFFLQRNPIEEEVQLLKLLFEYFELMPYKDRRFHQLSTGIQRLLLFMRALIKVPPVLLLDEPFQGMDKGLVEKCKYLLDQVLDERQTLIFISHYRKEWPEGIEGVLELGGSLK